MIHLLVLDACVITTLVAACQWASKLGAFGVSSAAWAADKGRVRAATTVLSVVLWSVWLLNQERPMPKGPRGEKRSADVIGNAVHVMKIATGQIEEILPKKNAASELARLGGLKGGKARAQQLSSKERAKIAKKAALIVGTLGLSTPIRNYGDIFLVMIQAARR